MLPRVVNAGNSKWAISGLIGFTRAILKCSLGGARFRRGYSEATDAYRGPRTALSSLENTIANSELALAA
jgi:hypothetical protein